jgi:hypothetical protein
MGLLYNMHTMVKCVCYTELWIHWFRDHSTTIPNGSVTIGQMSLVGVGHSRLDSIVPLMLRTVCCAMAGALALYYRSIGIAPTLLRMDNISGRPCMGVMTYNALTFSALKQLGNYCQFYTISFENLKPIKWCINGGNALFLVITQIARLLSLIELMLYLSCMVYLLSH